SGNMKYLKAFVRCCREEKLIDWRVKIPLPKLPKRLFPVLSDDDLVALFQSPDLVGTSEYAVRNRALLAILLDTGIRLGELAGLTPRASQGTDLKVIGK